MPAARHQAGECEQCDSGDQSPQGLLLLTGFHLSCERGARFGRNPTASLLEMLVRKLLEMAQEYHCC